MRGIAGIPGARRELITTFRPVLKHSSVRRVQSEEFVLFSDRLVQSELRVFELCAPCLRHVDVLVCVCVPISLLSLELLPVVSDLATGIAFLTLQAYRGLEI